jgi:hypothetical protein
MALVGLLTLVAGCSDGYEKIDPQLYNDDYEVFSVLNRAGNLSIFLINAFESDGKVALCGGYTKGGMAATNMSRMWADTSQVYIDGTRIGTAQFMRELPVYGIGDGEDPNPMWRKIARMKPSMPCVRSEIPWKAKFGKSKIERKGADGIRIRG